MAQTPIYRFSGQSYAITCGTAVAGPVTVTGNPPRTCAFINATNTAVAVSVSVLNATSAPTGFVFPTNGSPSIASCFILPPLMQMPLVAVVPGDGFNVFGISQSSGNPTIQFTPCELQS